MYKKFILAAVMCIFSVIPSSRACTGITLVSGDSSRIVARTIEWGGTFLNSGYSVVPSGYRQTAMAPDGGSGMEFVSRYGYVGLYVMQPEFVTEGLNEAGLSAGLFYFPGYGKYVEFDASRRACSIPDLQLVSWILSSFSDVDQVREAIDGVDVVALYKEASTVHWRVADASGKQIVIEIIGGKVTVSDNTIGVLTNSPDFGWQVTNLNNYVNLYPGTAKPAVTGTMSLSSFGAGSGFLGIPGDVTPPSRFVRAAFYQNTAPVLPSSEETVMQCFHILNNFDIPIGVEFAQGQTPEGIPSATQWTSVTDMTHLVIYYKTAWNGNIRAIDLKRIDFRKVKFQSAPLDKERVQPVEMIKIK